jgi:hypothetical protein
MTKRERLEAEYFSAQSSWEAALRRMNDALFALANLDGKNPKGLGSASDEH